MHAPTIPAQSFNLAVWALAFVCVFFFWGGVCKSLLYNKLAIFRVGETATLKIANQL